MTALDNAGNASTLECARLAREVANVVSFFDYNLRYQI